MALMKDAERREALETISRESERLRNLAQRSGGGYLAFLFEQALHDARSTLIAEGYVPRARGLSASEADTDLASVPLWLPRRPHKSHAA